MAEQETRRGGGAKTSRSETVTVRLDPRLRYLAEVAARVQRRTLSSFIEWAVEDSLNRVVMHTEDDGKSLSVANVDARTPLWDVDESDRFAILASYFPNLLTHDEQKLWKLISEVWSIMQPVKDTHERTKGFWLDMKDLQLLREHWQVFKDAADGGVMAQSVVEAIQGAKQVERGINVMGNVGREVKKRRKAQSDDTES